MTREYLRLTANKPPQFTTHVGRAIFARPAGVAKESYLGQGFFT